MALDLALPAALLLAKFALGYLAVLATPGPNMLAVAGLAALRGFRSVMPFVVGIACGAGALALAVWFAFDALPQASGNGALGRAAGAMILLLVALRMGRVPPPVPASAGRLPHDDEAGARVGFGAGFLTAVVNPVTAAYCAAQFLGPLASTGAGLLAPALVMLQALAFGVLVAVLFTRPGARRLALRYHRQICLISGLMLAALAVLLMTPLLHDA